MLKPISIAGIEGERQGLRRFCHNLFQKYGRNQYAPFLFLKRQSINNTSDLLYMLQILEYFSKHTNCFSSALVVAWCERQQILDTNTT